jgi:hypothetical protein
VQARERRRLPRLVRQLRLLAPRSPCPIDRKLWGCRGTTGTPAGQHEGRSSAEGGNISTSPGSALLPLVGVSRLVLGARARNPVAVPLPATRRAAKSAWADYRAGKLQMDPEQHAALSRWHNVGQLLGVVAIVAPWVVARVITRPGTGLVVGIVLVVLLGALGLVLRGLGELRQSPRLKAYGYFVGAVAYVATASVALSNGLPLLLQS